MSKKAKNQKVEAEQAKKENEKDNICPIDLGDITYAETIEIELLHPTTGQKTGMVIEAYHTDSKKYNAVVNALRNKRMNNRGPKPTAESLQYNSKSTVAKCTVSFKNIVENGVPIECNYDNAMKLYSKHSWIYEQVNVEMDNRDNFLSFAPKKQ